MRALLSVSGSARPEATCSQGILRDGVDRARGPRWSMRPLTNHTAEICETPPSDPAHGLACRRPSARHAGTTRTSTTIVRAASRVAEIAGVGSVDGQTPRIRSGDAGGRPQRRRTRRLPDNTGHDRSSLGLAPYVARGQPEVMRGLIRKRLEQQQFEPSPAARLCCRKQTQGGPRPQGRGRPERRSAACPGVLERPSTNRPASPPRPTAEARRVPRSARQGDQPTHVLINGGPPLGESEGALGLG